MTCQLPTVSAGEYAVLFAKASQPLLPEEEAWIKASEGNVLVFYSMESLSVTTPRENTFSTVVVREGPVNDSELQKMYTLLKSGGSLLLQRQPEESESALLSSLVLSGFIDSEVTKDGRAFTVTSQKPNYDAEAAAIPVNNAQKIWKLNANDFDDAGYELEDEDQLLDDETDIKPKAAAEFDCGPGGPGQKKRACKNCVCGLKEMLDEEEKAPASDGTVIQPNASACGNCSKGDAFRCASCPYLGTPSFDSEVKPQIKINEDGTKILLDVQNEAL